FQPGLFAAHAEAHVARLPGDTQFVQQRDEVRVGAVVEDDEAGIDRVAAAVEFDVVSVRMTADMAACFEHGDVMLALQVIGDGVAGDAAADDGDSHALLRGLMWRDSRMAGVTSRMSQISPRVASSFRPYQVGSIS